MISPITGEKIPAHKVHEHMRIGKKWDSCLCSESSFLDKLTKYQQDLTDEVIQGFWTNWQNICKTWPTRSFRAFLYFIAEFRDQIGQFHLSNLIAIVSGKGIARIFRMAVVYPSGICLVSSHFNAEKVLQQPADNLGFSCSLRPYCWSPSFKRVIFLSISYNTSQINIYVCYMLPL